MTVIARFVMVCLAIVASVSGVSGSGVSVSGSPPAVAAPADHPPTFAYFYIWFDPTSWNRAKTDLPLAGKYSSDEQTVMRDQVRMAKAAGLDGFIVSWKSTEKLNRRLHQLADIAAQEHFGLVVMYQGLDFERDPLTIDRVAADLDVFENEFASLPAFAVFDKPAVVLSGSWEFTPDEIADLGAGRRDRLLLLSSEKNVEGIERLSGLVDGNAYYWSSVNPDTFPDYQGKLDAMAAAVHAGHGLWIAPASAGFDARLIGGTTIVDRSDGDQLRRQYAAAEASSPDAVGIISWNEFSENSHIEPSRKFASQYLDVTAQLLGGTSVDRSSNADAFDSSEPSSRGSGSGQAIAVVAAGGLSLVALAVVWMRRRGQPPMAGAA